MSGTNLSVVQSHGPDCGHSSSILPARSSQASLDASLHFDLSQMYFFGDPITSFSFGRGGVLTLKFTTGKGLQKMLIMAGKLHAEYWHGVPSRSSWNDLMSVAVGPYQFCLGRSGCGIQERVGC